MVMKCSELSREIGLLKTDGSLEGACELHVLLTLSSPQLDLLIAQHQKPLTKRPTLRSNSSQVDTPTLDNEVRVNADSFCLTGSSLLSDTFN